MIYLHSRDEYVRDSYGCSGYGGILECLTEKVSSGKASKSEVKLYNLIGKAMVLLANDPRHPGLQSHEIEVLTARYGTKVWCSYLQNNTPAAGRIFWSYGPDKGDITIVAIEPHPNDSKSNAYKKITLSLMQTKKE